MEITRHKKAQLQAVRKKILLLFLFFWGYNYNCQSQNIIGEFKRIDPSTAARDIGVKFVFKENFRFERTDFMHLGTQEKSHGNYSISKDTLFLNYEKYADSLGSSLEMIQKKKIKSLSNSGLENPPLYSKIQVFNNPGTPQSGANLVLRNKEQEIIMAFMSDTEGFFPFLNIYDRYIENFQISALGKKEIVIKTDTLFGFKTKIKIHFQDSSKSIKSKETTEKFLIQEITDNKLRLLTLEEELVLLKKIKK
ncbi:hypothetical protein [Salegentibacter sediminis]|uniref:hypothetical protein n=1 Tax=Salegentibacter sediminis TaxID=1930251 RepID=UPI0009C09F17|nr:hypothetical protein [Salegentibacter sediminis]